MTFFEVFHDKSLKSNNYSTVCPRSIDLFYIAIYNVNWVTTSWTHRKLLYMNAHDSRENVAFFDVFHDKS